MRCHAPLMRCSRRCRPGPTRSRCSSARRDARAGLVPIRYGRMLASPFAFYRGAAAMMAARPRRRRRASGLTVQFCGDAHLSNFGVFASPERQLVFDVNDFDETLPGPWEWDVKRLAASMVIAARDNGFRAKAQERIVLEHGRSATATAMASSPGMRNLDVWYAHLDIENVLEELRRRSSSRRSVKRTEKTLAKARTKDSMQAFSKLTHVVDGAARIIDRPAADRADRAARTGRGPRRAVRAVCAGWCAATARRCEFDRRVLLEQFELTDLARKVVGVGSVGTRAWIALLLGRDGQDPLFLQVKEAEASVLEEYLGPSEYATTASASSSGSG